MRDEEIEEEFQDEDEDGDCPDSPVTERLCDARMQGLEAKMRYTFIVSAVTAGLVVFG